jgi:hypothetical protein
MQWWDTNRAPVNRLCWVQLLADESGPGMRYCPKSRVIPVIRFSWEPQAVAETVETVPEDQINL